MLRSNCNSANILSKTKNVTAIRQCRESNNSLFVDAHLHRRSPFAASIQLRSTNSSVRSLPIRSFMEA
ncbi:hypothetical protein L6452_43185 [Arctium lappa]|uniref:Uncharacterized protein n=1 Tax=Arctium lappa TaxID=4217 RepID=A0ACB8XKP3_ARCLA|nr:hypothetical protein L6452_43185 [Arctium lappa]